jgi:type I restriction enzyme S subunit
LDGSNCVDLVISKPGPRILPEYLALWINSAFGKDQVLKGQGGLAQQHFNVAEMRNLLVLRPETREQKMILDTLNAQAETIRLEHCRLAKLLRLKTGLMQDLLTGKVPVEPLLETETAK